MTNMTAVSLFAGIGGFDLALERNGVSVVSAVEIDRHSQAVLAQHFPNTHIYGDAKDVNPNDLLADGFIPERGIITAGFPCQPFSRAGKRRGMDDERGQLWWEVSRITEALTPRWLLIENVPGLLTSESGRTFSVILSDLGRLGYGVAWRVFDAQFYGVPQRRRRLFALAHHGAIAPAEAVLFEPQGGSRSLGAQQSLRSDLDRTVALCAHGGAQ